MTKRIAIIGAGGVGATAAYYLSKSPDCQVTVFDHGLGQATKAAAGIICPWFSRRRHKAWYRMARLGADFYQTLVADLQADGADTGFYKQTGVYILKKKPEYIEEVYGIAKERQLQSPIMGDLAIETLAEVQQRMPDLTGFDRAVSASGAGRVDGALMTDSLLKAAKVPIIKEKVTLTLTDQTYQIAGQTFDQIILATGAWLGDLLTPLGYRVDVRPQKGQLRDYWIEGLDTSDYALVMPEGEFDLIPFDDGRIAIGATHENDQGFDLTVDEVKLDAMAKTMSPYWDLGRYTYSYRNRVGIRAYTSDYAPFYGQVPGLPGVYAASGLGSSGLTTGPLIGRELAKMILGEKLTLDPADYPIANYVTK